MAERKILNKYYPPDFNPKKLPAIRGPKNKQKTVRMMLPMRIPCNTCGSYLSEGTKFNSREKVIGETYLGIPIVRFYLKCSNCSAEIVVKTDPRNSGYVVEIGAKVVRKREREEEERVAVTKSLENRRREVEDLIAIDELRFIKSRQATVTVATMLENLRRTAAYKKEKCNDEGFVEPSAARQKKRKVSEEEHKINGTDGFNGKATGSRPSFIITAIKKAAVCEPNTGLQLLCQYDDSEEED